MILFNTLIYSPGGEHENGTAATPNDENQKDSSLPIPEKEEPVKESKPIIETIREALQDWSNKDESDLEDDDTKV